MKIAVLAWGSLVRDRRNLRGAAKFAPNGPLLPIEFCRVSGDGRLTLVIDETFGAICTTYSVPSALDDLDGATENLRIREEMLHARGIGFVEPASGKSSDVAMRRHPQAVATITAWAQSNGYDAAIWKIVASNFAEPDKGGEPFSVTAAIRVSRSAGNTGRRDVCFGAGLHSECAPRGSDAGARRGRQALAGVAQSGEAAQGAQAAWMRLAAASARSAANRSTAASLRPDQYAAACPTERRLCVE